jgi:hypothetical protein
MIWQKLKHQHEAFLSESITDRMGHYLCDEATNEAKPRLQHHINIIVTWMARALLGNGPVNTGDTRSQQWNNEVTQPASRQRLSRQTSAQAQ